MTKAADANLEPFIDNLWYFDSVVSAKPPLNQRTPGNPNPAAAVDEKSAAHDDQYNLAGFSESQLPLSTGGESSPRAPCSCFYTDQESDNEATLSCGDGRICASCKSAGRPSMCDLVEKIEEDEAELTATDLHLWMQKLGLEYTEDGAMIRRVPTNANLGSQQTLDFSEFVCLNRFIEEEHSSRQHVEHHGLHRSFSDAHMASLYEVFRVFDKDDSGLISPSDLCAALTTLGLRSLA